MRMLVMLLYMVLSAHTQAVSGTVLQVDVSNVVLYYHDIADYSKLAASTAMTPAAAAPNFRMFVGFGDIIAINGQPAKGLWATRATATNLRLDPMAPDMPPGMAVSDVERGSISDMHWEIQSADGTPIGSLMASGLSLGAPTPGAPASATTDNLTITGGTGAFLGARGQAGRISSTTRSASVAENPALRRVLGGGTWRWLLHVVPLNGPEIAVRDGVPMIFHNDFTPVTAASPARVGEVLILAVRNLGPTRPSLQPGDLFAREPLHVINSPVDVIINGRSSQILNQVGWPGSADLYRVDALVPDISPGPASVQLRAAWIPTPAVSIQIK